MSTIYRGMLRKKKQKCSVSRTFVEYFGSEWFTTEKFYAIIEASVGYEKKKVLL